MSLRTPLGRVLGKGSAGDGVGHWWVQRVTAVALIPLTAWFAISLLGKQLQSYEVLRGWLAQPWVAVFAALLVITVAWHSKLGVQVVVGVRFWQNSRQCRLTSFPSRPNRSPPARVMCGRQTGIQVPCPNSEVRRDPNRRATAIGSATAAAWTSR